MLSFNHLYLSFTIMKRNNCTRVIVIFDKMKDISSKYNMRKKRNKYRK